MTITDEEFKQLKYRVEKLEAFVFDKKMIHKKVQKDKKSLQDFIIELRDNRFFSQPRISQEVHEKINTIYPCELNRIAVALVRLSEKKELRKSSKTISGKKYKAYVWSNQWNLIKQELF